MDFKHEMLGENALLLRFGDCIDAAVNVRVHAACAALRALDLEGLEEVVPGYASVLLRFDPRCQTLRDTARVPEAVLQKVCDALRGCTADETETTGHLHRLHVCYGGDHGADLESVAQHLSMSPDDVIKRHCATEYRVAMLGFAPGFAYLLGMDRRLHVPRRKTPRTRVPAGSVGIGGAQTGIYPSALPGGWQLIGCTPEVMFDARNQDHPCRLAPGDRVRFEAIDNATFDALQRADR